MSRVWGLRAKTTRVMDNQMGKQPEHKMEARCVQGCLWIVGYTPQYRKWDSEVHSVRLNIQGSYRCFRLQNFGLEVWGIRQGSAWQQVGRRLEGPR